MKKHQSRGLSSLCVLLAVASSACNSLIGLDDFSVQGKTVVECTTNQECTDRATAAHSGTQTYAVCVKEPAAKCVELITPECPTIEGDPLDGDPIILGTMFTITGAQMATNLARQQSAQLAIRQINKPGGVPSSIIGQNRKLVLLSCDEDPKVFAASANHLVNELHVPGIVGPNTSQDTLNLSNDYTIEGRTVVMTPTGVASSITGLVDNDLTWQMVPTDVQRASLMISQINEIEAKLRADRGQQQVKLGIVFRDDALGAGTRTALSSMSLNGAKISDQSNFGKFVYIDGYDFTKPDQAALVQKYVEFAPDIVVLAGTAEAISQVMKPLEMGWNPANPNRPQYVLIDSVKVPDLITLATGNEDLRKRVRGTGIKAGPETAGIYSTFQLDYQVAFPGMSASTSGMGSSYDAAYALAYALAATRTEPVSGTSIAKGLRSLAGGTMKFEVGSAQVTQAFQKLAAGEKIKAMGTFVPLDWDPTGAVVGGTLEMWCIGLNGTTPTYKNSGLDFDVRTGMATGMYNGCP